MLAYYPHVDGCIFNVDHIREQFATHVTRKGSQSGALNRTSLLVNDQDSFGGIRVCVRIAESGVGLDGSNDVETVKLHAIPATRTDVPSQNRFITGEAHLAIRKALAGVHVRAARLYVIAGDLRLRELDKRDKNNRETNRE